jgi:2-polyprenyl-3-methyl-5-hydroxy-6-metoxy-1,4-benzoquinol methylase
MPMSSFHPKKIIKQICPPIVWDAGRRFCAWRRARAAGKASVSSSHRIVRTLEELDREIARADEAAVVSDDALRKALAEFSFEANQDLPADPDSAEYREAQMQVYRRVTGREVYSADVSEMFAINLDMEMARPFPYSTRSSVTVGEQLMAVGFLIRAMELERGVSVLEFGPGCGTTTVEFAKMGQPVTAVDINSAYLELIGDRCRRLGQEVELVCSDMLKYRPTAKVDRVVFYESFHHCSDHVQMIKNLDDLVAANGRVFFAGEPIEDDFPMAWGVRLDGMSAWSMRKFGWLELGFRTDYFIGLLARHGWTTQVLDSRDVSWQRVFAARRPG